MLINKNINRSPLTKNIASKKWIMVNFNSNDVREPAQQQENTCLHLDLTPDLARN